MALIMAQVKLTLANGKTITEQSSNLNVNLVPPGQEKAVISNARWLHAFNGYEISEMTTNSAVLAFDVMSADPKAEIDIYISGWDAWPTHSPDAGGNYGLIALSNVSHQLAGGVLRSELRTDVMGYRSNLYTVYLPNGVTTKRSVQIQFYINHSGASIPSPTANIVVENLGRVLAQTQIKLRNILN